MTKDEALKLALEALEAAYARLVTKCEQNLVTYNGVDVDTLTLSQEAIATIKKALAQPEQEPVAWVSSEELLVMRGNALGGAKDWRINVGLVKQENDVGLYTIPPQRTWVGLMDEEVDECYYWKDRLWTTDELVRHVEAKLKEKNG